MPTSVQHYKQSLEKLNAQQARAVQQTEGPVLVLAGPGTGKTEVLAVRIGYILEQQPISPHNILCLTFSNAGVQAMRKRLKELIGETADKVEISTFHAFSNKLITKYAAENIQGKSLITDAQRSMLIEKLIHDFMSAEDPQNIKPASGKKISNLAGIFASLKQEGLTREEIEQHANYCIENILPYEEKYLKQNQELNVKGRELKDKILHFAEKISAMYEAYCNELEKRNKIEFEDMLMEAIMLLQTNEQLILSLRENYLYILVDEFQDTNKKQIALLDLLVSGNMEPNLFVVGDDDQCIYRFQGASELSFDWMRKKFQHSMQTIVLDTNYRSTSVLLQEAFGLISKNENRQPEKTNVLIAGNPKYDGIDLVLPTFKSYENADQEACAVVQSIVKQLNNGKHAEQLAVLARRHYDFEAIKKWLHRYNIPWQNNQHSYNLLDGFYGESLFYLLQFIINQDTNGYNASGFFTQFMLLKPKAELFVKATLKCRQQKKYNVYEYLREHANEFANAQEMIKAIDTLLASKGQPVNDDMLKHLDIAIYAGTGIEPIDQEQKTWHEFVQAFLATDRYKTIASLGDLVWYHMQNQISIKVDDSEKEIDDNAVILSTIHGSKGLQYDTVYLIACHNKNWEDRDQRGLMKVPDLLNRYISPEADSLDDMRKLIYVACTRAETELHVSMHRKTYSDKDIANTALLNSFGNENGISLEIIDDFELPELETNRYKVQADAELIQLIREKLDAFEISPTSTGVWVKCQNEFFFTQILKVGGFFNEAAAFGTVVHNVLQHYAENENRNAALIPILVDQQINVQKHLFHSTHVDKYRQYARWLIPDYLRKNAILRKPDHLEAELHAFIGDGVKIKGKMDRIEINGDSVKVIDYKTGRSKESLRAFENNTEPGSQYWRQAMMYSMLVRSNFQDKKNIDFEFHYPEIEKGIYSFNEADNAAFNEWLEQIWYQTQQLEFDRSCENPSCEYCAARLN